MTGFHVGRAECGLIDLEVEFEAFGQIVGEEIGFFVEVAGVDEDDGDIGDDLSGQMEHDGGLNAEAGGEYEAAGESLVGPADDVGGLGGLEIGIHGFEIDGRWGGHGFFSCGGMRVGQ